MEAQSPLHASEDSGEHPTDDNVGAHTTATSTDRSTLDHVPTASATATGIARGGVGAATTTNTSREAGEDGLAAAQDVDAGLNYQSMSTTGNVQQSAAAAAGGIPGAGYLEGHDFAASAQRNSNNNNNSSKYRGFSTPISGMFQDPASERVDCCAMACCGVLQSDRDRYLVTGVEPPSCARRFWLHTILPLCVFLAAGFCAFRIRDPLLNQMISTTLVFTLIGVFVIQCFKGSWKRQGVRRDLLWMKHHLITTGYLEQRMDEDSFDIDEPNEHQPSYLMGQTKRDIRTSHSLCSCYVTDIARLDDAQIVSETNHARNNICSFLFRCWSGMCCSAMCGMNLQICGICALAQEGRELERTISPAQRRIDYITMQPFMEYYPSIFKARHGEGQVQLGVQIAVNRMIKSISARFTTQQSEAGSQSATAGDIDGQEPVSMLDGISSLSKGMFTSTACFLVVALAWSTVSSRFGHYFGISNFIVLVATLAQSLIILTIVYWRHTKDISVDAIVKFFFCGFFLSTTLAVFFEILFGLSIRLFMTILMAISGIDEEAENGFQDVLDTAPTFGTLGPFGAQWDQRTAQSYRDFLGVFGTDHPIFYTIYLMVVSYLLAATVEELCKYFGFRMASDHPDFMSARDLEESIDVYNEMHSNADEEDVQHLTSGITRQRITLPCAQQERSMESRGAAITVAMVTVSIGFACCENLVYIFLYSDRSLAGEIIVLIARSLFPIHPIAAAIQSIGVCGRDLEKDPKMTLNRIVVFSVLFHGSYDFFIMWIDFIVSLDGNYVIADDDSVMASDASAELYSILVSFAILIAGVGYYVSESGKQRERLRAMDRDSTVNRSRLI